jgi:hypothetical protein
LPENSSELRLLLCRDKHNNGKRSTNVVTACGIFVSDILEAAPIDKYFEMFKPGSGQEGGFVRLKMTLVSEAEMKNRQKGLFPTGSLCLVLQICQKEMCCFGAAAFLLGD